MLVYVLVGLEALTLAGMAILLLKRNAGATNSEDIRNLEQVCRNGFQDGKSQAREELQAQRLELAQHFTAQREQMRESFKEFMTFLGTFQEQVRKLEAETVSNVGGALQNAGDRSEQQFRNLVKTLDDSIKGMQETMLGENREFRREQHGFQGEFMDSVGKQFQENRELVDSRLTFIQEENRQKLDEMKKTVDEKLQESMERHFNESFKLISERLEQVHKGLGEMQGLAAGVGDLKKVLTNVKTRGNIGEIQLATILEDYLASDQFLTNVSTVPNSRELVEFAVKLPGKNGDDCVLLPIDSKFPVEDFHRLQKAYDQYSRMSPECKHAQEDFARTVKKCAGDIRDKYLYPPRTTGFGIMFVPSESIYAEILRLPGLFETVQQVYKIAIVGPANLVAYLNSLQLGFRTLAIERRSQEVWNILGTVKTEFGKFGKEMDATRKSLQYVVNHMDSISTRSRAMERSLKDVQALPASHQEMAEGSGEENA